VQAVLGVFYFSSRAERVQMFGPRRRLINVGCAGTARSADNLKGGAGNRLASIHRETQPWRVFQCNLCQPTLNLLRGLGTTVNCVEKLLIGGAFMFHIHNEPFRHVRQVTGSARLQVDQGAQAAPQVQARSPRNGRSGWFSQTHRPLSHVVQNFMVSPRRQPGAN
jgi:hypothetical protein